jgi:YesN/AraC family two-component response regulator
MEDALIESETLRIQNEEFISKQEALTLKYQKVRLDEGECADIVARMKDYVERERVYTDSDLKMKDLADVLHLSAPKLSQVFNLYLKENYYEYINRYRLEEFKRLIDDGEYKRYTITALSEQCGFKKSNFFSTFRKVEGMTPAEYLKKRGVKV